MTKPTSKPIAMKFLIKADKTTFSGKMVCTDDDGTTTLPMMIHTLLKEVSKDHAQLRNAKSITLEARFV